MQVVKEVGSNTFFDTDFAQLNSRTCSLLLQFSDDSLSYSILDNTSNTVLYTAVSDLVFDLYEVSSVQLAQLFLSEKLFNFTYQKVIVSIDTMYSTLVPNDFFDTTKKEELLSFNIVLPKVDLSFYADELSEQPYYNVYAVPKTLVDLLKKSFLTYQIKASESLLIDLLSSENSIGNYFHLQVSTTQMHCIYLKDKHLQFNNVFNINNSEDILYHILNIYKQLGLNTEVSILNISGIISEQTENYNLLYKYLKNIKFTSRPLKLNFDNRLNEMPSHYFLQHYAAFL